MAPATNRVELPQQRPPGDSRLDPRLGRGGPMSQVVIDGVSRHGRENRAPGRYHMQRKGDADRLAVPDGLSALQALDIVTSVAMAHAEHHGLVDLIADLSHDEPCALANAYSTENDFGEMQVQRAEPIAAIGLILKRQPVCDERR